MPSSPGCLVCGKELKLRNKRDKERKKFCSNSCKGRFGGKPKRRTQCVVCGSSFLPTNYSQKYCSDFCIPNYNQTTEEQYKRINGNPIAYFVQNLQRIKRLGGTLSVIEVLELLEQQKGKCALTGVKLTFQRINGIRCLTNASIDRIETGGPYTKENVRLVCAVVNNMRWTLADEELKYWCKLILNPVEV